MMDRTRAIRLAVVLGVGLLLVGLGGATVGAAQTGGPPPVGPGGATPEPDSPAPAPTPTPDAPETPTATPTPEPDSGSGTPIPANGSASSGGGGLFGLSAWGFVKGALLGILADMKESAAGILNGFQTEAHTLPAPGIQPSAENPAPLGSWYSPSDEWWQTTYAVMATVTAIGLYPLIIAFAHARQTRDPRRRKALSGRLKKSLLGIALTPLTIGLALHTTNILSVAFAPSGMEFLADFGNVSRLGVGIIFGVGLLATKPVVVVAAVIITYVMKALVFILAALWTAFWVAYAMDTNTTRAVGGLGFATFGFLCALKVLQSILLRLAFELPMGSIQDALLALVMTTAILAVVYIGMPFLFYRNGLPEMMTTTASTVSSGAAAGVETARNSERVQDYSDRVRDRVGYGGGTTQQTVADGGTRADGRPNLSPGLTRGGNAKGGAVEGSSTESRTDGRPSARARWSREPDGRAEQRRASEEARRRNRQQTGGNY